MPRMSSHLRENSVMQSSLEAGEVGVPEPAAKSPIGELPESKHGSNLTEGDVTSNNSVNSETEANAAQTDSKKPVNHTKLPFLGLIALAILSFLTAYNSTITLATLPSIKFLEGSSIQGFWVALAYHLTTAIFQPLGIALSITLGRGRLLMFSTSCLIVGSIVAATASNFVAVIAGRAIQGIGAAGCTSLALILPAKYFPIDKQQTWIGIVEGSQAVGFILGAIIGAGFAQGQSTWRSMFYFNLPLCVVALVAVPFAFGYKGNGITLRQSIPKLDLIGNLLYASSLVLLLIALSCGGVIFSWRSAVTIVLLILGIASFAIAYFWQSVGATEPFMRRRLFYRRTANIAYFCTFVQGFVMFSQLYFISLYLESVKLTATLIASVSLLAFLLPIVPSFILAGAFSLILGSYTKVVWAGLSLLTLSSGLTLVFNLTTPPAVWAIILLLSGISHGLIINSLDHTIQTHANDADVVHAATMSVFLRSLGIPIGVSVSSSVFLNLMKDELEHLGQPGGLSQHALELISDLRQIPDSYEAKTLVRQSYAHGCKGVFALLTAISGVTLLLSLLMKARPSTTQIPIIKVDGKELHTVGGPEYREQRELVSGVDDPVLLSTLPKPAPTANPRRPPPRPARSPIEEEFETSRARHRPTPSTVVAGEPDRWIVRNTTWFSTPHAQHPEVLEETTPEVPHGYL